jgi:hypothetical protein
MPVSCCTSTANAGSSAASRRAMARCPSSGPTGRRRCARRSTRSSCPARRPRSTAKPRPSSHAGRGSTRGAGLLHRLRLSRGRVLPPAARRRHADVPSRASWPTPIRWPPSAQGHHRACRLHRHRAGRAGRRARRAGYTSQARFLDQLRPDRAVGARQPARTWRWRRCCVNEHEMGELFKVIAFGPRASISRPDRDRRPPASPLRTSHDPLARHRPRARGVQRDRPLAREARPQLPGTFASASPAGSGSPLASSVLIGLIGCDRALDLSC